MYHNDMRRLSFRYTCFYPRIFRLPGSGIFARSALRLRNDSRLGRSARFMPATPSRRVSRFMPDPVATGLIERVDAWRMPAP
ncbi:MAG TPA: hypothetical protein VME63_04195 [Dyella sp.]|uniref:hypothetical protein n=1 Tax=Dyella sp. TaxID=1869338 RepID=UPI002B918FAD|nr:hypothetical protein [Dyella sp.]HTV84579.1 hypothetical protein [Dyella sp.]